MKKGKNSSKNISIIIPVMNEEENIDVLAGEVTTAMESIGCEWECIWVDDLSTDDTLLKLTALNKRDPRNRVITHHMNYGQSVALATGFKYAKGDIFVTLDGDGQNDPASIPALIQELIDKKADMVNGWREKRNDSIIRKISSRIANFYRNTLTGEKIRDVGCALRAFRKECVKDIPVFKGMHRFFPTLVRLGGHKKILELPVNHRPRERGKTKYGINNRLWVGIVDTFAICWMRKRMVYPSTVETSEHETSKGGANE